MRCSFFGLFLFLGLGTPSIEPQPVPQRIISLSPTITEIIYGIGAFDRVVAVSEFCDFPPEVEKLPRVGGWQNTNLEKLASLRPDLVILTEAQAPFIQHHLDALGIPILVVRSQSLGGCRSGGRRRAGRRSTRSGSASGTGSTQAELDEI